MGHSCSFGTNLVSFRTFRCPLFPKPVTGRELFCAVSYSKPTLVNEWSLSSVYAGNTTDLVFFDKKCLAFPSIDAAVDSSTIENQMQIQKDFGSILKHSGRPRIANELHYFFQLSTHLPNDNARKHTTKVIKLIVQGALSMLIRFIWFFLFCQF